LRIALLLDPLTQRSKGLDHAPKLARELLGRGHAVRGFGAAPGTIPHSSDATTETDASGLASWRPDVLVAYDALSPTAWLGARTARKLDAALVLVEVGIEHPRRFHERGLQWVGERLWGGYVRSSANALVALDPVAERLALKEGFPKESITTLAQGVSLERFRPGLSSALVSRQRIRGRILLYVGRLEESRGVRTLLQAFARTVGQRSDWALVLAGEGSDRASLRAAADRLGVAERVHWLARPRPEELPALIGASTLLAVPATDDSVRGKQIPRAMGCGIPVLASDLPRLRFFVEPDVTGLVAPPGDVRAWSEIIQRAASSPVARARWGHRAREIAVERFSWVQVTEHFERVLLEAVRSQRRARDAQRSIEGEAVEKA
jgi:glycosyltransferase involved in cell wall biosynthesis